MINVQLYSHSTSLAPYLTDYLGGTEHITIVTPNPGYADMARMKFGQVHHSVEAITIAKFLKDELNQLVSSHLLENFKGKSDLNLVLGSLWKIKKSASSYEQFKRCFQILTDFRSFTLNEDILQTILENYDEDISTGVLWFHKIMEQMDIVDEHRSYFLLSEKLRSGDLPPNYQSNRTILFWGFDFLTGSQVDLLNALAIRNDVLLPFPKEVYEKSKDLDWIKWLTKFEAKVSTVDAIGESSKKLEVISFPKNYLGTCLKKLKENVIKEKSVDIVLGTKNLSEEHVVEVPFGEYSYKISIDLFNEKLELLKENLFESLKSEVITPSQNLIALARSFYLEAVEIQDFRAIKAVSVFLETLNNWVDLSDHNKDLGVFDLKIIFDSAKLDLPRNSLFASSSEKQMPLRSLKSLDQVVEAQISLLCVTGAYDSIKSSGIQYSENVEKYLASIGPVRRADFEFLILKSKICEYLSQEQTILIVEEGLIEHDLGWSNILSQYELTSLNINLNKETTKKYFSPKPNITYNLDSVSASKLQTFLDCPRKFYLSYVLKQRPRIELTHQLNYMQLGLIEHAVIENYLNRNTTFDEELLNELILVTLNEFELKGDLQAEKKEEYWLEVKAFCSEVIRELLIMNNILGLKLYFEKELPSFAESLKINGSIDCYGENSSTVMILDFKRGAGSIPSQTGLKDFNKIQLWFYLDKLKKSDCAIDTKKLIWGYVNLSSLEDSLIYCSDQATIDILKGLNINMCKKVYHFDEQMNQLADDYQKFESEQLEKINAEKVFDCLPKEIKVCQYCELSNICPREKGVMHVTGQ